MTASPFRQYLARTFRTKFLKPAEEQILLEKAAGGDKESIKKAALAYQPLAASIALSFKREEAVTEELLQEGNIGLLESIAKYEPGKGVALPVFASSRIRGAMLDYLKKEEISASRTLSLETPIDEERILADIIPDDNADMEKEIAAREKRRLASKKIREAMERLPERERHIIIMRHFEGKTLKEAAARLGKSPATIDRIEKKALRRIKGMLARFIKEYRSA